LKKNKVIHTIFGTVGRGGSLFLRGRLRNEIYSWCQGELILKERVLLKGSPSGKGGMGDEKVRGGERIILGACLQEKGP